MVSLASRFIEKNIIFQSANLVLSLILLPLMIHYINFIMPGLKIAYQNIWEYQKIFIVLGAITALILSSLTSKPKPHK